MFWRAAPAGGAAGGVGAGGRLDRHLFAGGGLGDDAAAEGRAGGDADAGGPEIADHAGRRGEDDRVVGGDVADDRAGDDHVAGVDLCVEDALGLDEQGGVEVDDPLDGALDADVLVAGEAADDVGAGGDEGEHVGAGFRDGERIFGLRCHRPLAPHVDVALEGSSVGDEDPRCADVPDDAGVRPQIGALAGRDVAVDGAVDGDRGGLDGGLDEAAVLDDEGVAHGDAAP
jgi:hypothetical protein